MYMFVCMYEYIYNSNGIPYILKRYSIYNSNGIPLI